MAHNIKMHWLLAKSQRQKFNAKWKRPSYYAKQYRYKEYRKLFKQSMVINSKATHLRIKSCFLKTQMINVRYYLSTLRYESYRCKIFQAMNFICFKEFFFKKNDYFPCGFSPNQSLNSAVKSIGPGDHTSSHQKRRFN